LYRWNPDQHKEHGKGFTLESERIKAELKGFLDRENELSLIINTIPAVPLSITNSLDAKYRRLFLNAFEA
jgi:sulfite reductase (NADPH) hemoprotein beta-component